MRCRTERNPVTTTLISGVNVPQNQCYRPKIPPMIFELLRLHNKPVILSGRTKTCGTQSIFRESETQTDPFTPEIKKPYQQGLEVLTLSWLSWNNGLPAGMREVVVIERARQMKAWNSALPITFNTTTRRIRSMIIEAIELNEWNHREVEIAALSSVRMELVRKCIEENLAANRIKYHKKLFKYQIVKLEEKEAAMEKVRRQFKRNLRKLTYDFKNGNRRWYRWDLWRKLQDKTSELYGPQDRFGIRLQRPHEIIPKYCRYWNVFSHAEILTQTLEMMAHPGKPKFDFVKKSKPRTKDKNLCIHETKWTTSALERLCHGLNRTRHQISQPRETKLRRKIFSSEDPIHIPAVPAVPQEVEDVYQTALTFQKIIKGRAAQSVMFTGRVRYQNLLEELRSTDAIQECIEHERAQRRQMIFNQRRQAELTSLEEKRKNEILLSLEGKTVSETLDFLSKELLRMQNEKETHAIVLMAERAKRKIEDSERDAQTREKSRQEQNEMWKQICKVYQNSVDIAAEEFNTFTSKQHSEEEARREAMEYAKKIDQAATEAHLRRDELQEAEIIADLVYNFALPEAEKEMVRTRLKLKHRSLLSTCHDQIYSQMETVVKGKRSPSGTLLRIPRPKPRRSLGENLVQYVNLARQSGSGSLSTSKSSLFEAMEMWEKTSPEQQCEFSDSDKWSTGFSRKEVIIQ